MPNPKHSNQDRPPSEPRRVMRLPETLRIAGVCDMTLRRQEAKGLFPKRFKLFPETGDNGAVRHDFDEVMEHHERRLASRSEPAS